MDIHDLDEIEDLDAREAFALAQGREDIVSEIDRQRRDIANIEAAVARGDVGAA